jgi:1,4-dihydroxy-2-naphthoate octaprenyltransferase
VIGRPTALFRDLRLSRPWSFKAPFLISVPYYVVVLSGLSLGRAFTGILASAMTIAGISGLAYWINDLADREVDARAGKPNLFLRLSPPIVLGLAIALVALAIVPWISILPLTARTAGLLALELALFLAYSVPPIRLKDRGGFGAIADALYAHVNPALLAAFTFAAFGGLPEGRLFPFVVVLGSWQLALGLRNILLHQLLDLEHDRAAGTRTWVARLGAGRGERILRRGLVPAELALFAAYAFVVAQEVRTFLPGLVAFVALETWILRVRWRRAFPLTLRDFLFNYVDDFYVEWIPVLILLQLGLGDAAFLALLAVHVLLFPKNALRRVVFELRPRPD